MDALTRQLEELRKGNTSNSYHVASNGNNNSVKFNQEFEKLRQELLVSASFVFDNFLHPLTLPIYVTVSIAPCPESVLGPRDQEKSFEPKEE